MYAQMNSAAAERMFTFGVGCHPHPSAPWFNALRLLLAIATLSLPPHHVHSVFLHGAETSHLRFPKWNSCPNSSIAFHFRTTQREGLLLYADDGGRSDFLEVFHVPGHVKASLRIADVRLLSVAATVNDGRWHHAEVRRSGPQTTLSVDGVSESSFSFGTDLNFGLGPENNSHVYVGGLPPEFGDNLRALSLPSAFFRKRFNGHVRNVLYGNCTCMRVKVDPLDGAGYDDRLVDPCRPNGCQKQRGCICLSLDANVICDCADKHCVAGIENQFRLSFDHADGILLNQSSDVNASILGPVVFQEGVYEDALLVGPGAAHVIVSGADCLGASDNCLMGFTLSFWVKFLKSCSESNTVVLSSAKRLLHRSGFTMLYDQGTLVAEFRKDSLRWSVSHNNLLTERWHQVAVTWHRSHGFTLYLNGEMVRRAEALPATVFANATAVGELVFGCPSIDATTCGSCQMLIDEFDFRSKLMNGNDIKESGPLFCYLTILMDSPRQTIGHNVSIHLYGGTMDRGKIGNATFFDGIDDYLDGGNQEHTCLGNLVLCKDGVMISMWIQVVEHVSEFFFFSTGSKGIEIYSKDDVLFATARQGVKLWHVSWAGFTERKWCFLELTWKPTSGLQVHVDQKEAAVSRAPSSREPPAPTGARLYIGRSNSVVANDQRAPAVGGVIVAGVDQVDICYGGRETLEFIGLVYRGRPTKYSIDMDLIVNGHFVLTNSNINATAVKNPLTVPGKINNATRLDGTNQYVDLGYHGDSCLGNLMHCRHGFTGSMWAKFRKFENGMFFLSNGGGIQVFYEAESIRFVFSTLEKQWDLNIPAPSADVWHFIEFSWNPDFGLKVYVNNKLVRQDVDFSRIDPSAVKRSAYGRGSFRIGYANDGDLDGVPVRSGNLLVDESEFWFGDRDTLLAFGHIARENVSHVTFTFDYQPSDLTFSLHDGASLVPGKFGNGTNLRGRSEYVKFDIPKDSCAADLEHCSNGLTINFFIKFGNLAEKNAYVLSGALYSVLLRDRRLVAEFYKLNKVWEVQSEVLEVDKWYRVEISWDEDKGLQLYFDKLRVAHATDPREHSRSPSDFNVYLGKAGNGVLNFTAPDVTVDQVEFWFANRDHVRAFGFLEDDVNGLTLDMERIENDLLSHQTHVIYVHGAPRTVPTNRGNALQLNGLNQFLDVGKDVACKGNLENCPKGFTLRFNVKPLQLQNNTYFISSALVEVYYRNDQLIADVRTPDREWLVTSSRFEPRVWTQLDVSWDPVEGLALYVNGKLVDQDTVPSTNELDYNATKRFFIGKANTDMRVEHYANAIFDDVEIWEANRDRLIKQGHIEAIRSGGKITSSRRSTKKVPPTENFAVRRTTTQRSPHRMTPQRPATRAYYIQIPTGKPFQNATARYGDPGRLFFPTLPPHTKKMLVFDGHSYIVYDVIEFPDEYRGINDFEQVRFKLKTSDPNGLLWFSGNEDRNVHFSIKSGLFLMVINYDGKFNVEKFRVTGTRLDDDEWHDVYVTRNKKHVTIAVDGKEHPKMLIDDISFVIPDSVYLAGSDDTRKRTRLHMRNNFRGTLDKVIFSGDSLPSDINFIDAAFVKPTPPYIEIFGNVNSVAGGSDAATAMEPGAITFTKDYSYLRLPLWDAERRGSIEFFVKTVEPHGLLVYSGGQASHRDFFAVELFDGVAYVVIDLGTGVHRFTFADPKRVVNDGRPHYLKVDRVERTLRLTLDRDERVQNIVSGRNSLNLGTFLFLGAVDNPNRLPWHLWTRNPKFFVGCVWGMKINDDELLDLPSFVVEQGMTGIEVGCRAKPLACVHPFCKNGFCVDRWEEPECQCQSTPFTGKLCDKPALMVAFTGTEMTRVVLRPMQTTHTNDVSVRFKTSRKNGLLFKTLNRASNDYLKAFLNWGNVVLETNLGGSLQAFQSIVTCDVDLSQGQWHTLHLRRRANQMSAWLDDCDVRTTESPGEGYTLDIDQLVVGRESPFDEPANAFVGHMQNLVFGSVNIFELLEGNNATGGTGITIENTGELTYAEIPIPLDPVTFRLYSDAYAVLDVPSVYTASLSFMLRTSQPEGLILYRPGLDRDFFVVDMVDGRLRVLTDDGTGAKEALTSMRLNDSDWHVVSIDQLSPKRINVSVDRSDHALVVFPNSSQSLDLGDLIVFGKIPEAMAVGAGSETFSAREGFAGCLASVFVGGHLFGLLTDSVNRSGLVKSGCTDLRGFCGPNVCRHFGGCKEVIDDFICDCNLTSFVGKTCQDESEGYRFGFFNSRGIATLSTNGRPESDRDVLAFGFMTWHSNGTMVRTESRTNAHYIDARLEDGLVVVEFDIGHEAQRISQEFPMMNDSLYHHVLFEHTGPNASLRVDDYPQTQLISAMDPSRKLLNDLSVIKIGGNLNIDDGIVNHFDGIIAGVYFNGIRVIDVGLYEAEKMMITRGDIILAIHPFDLPKPTGNEDSVRLTDVPPIEGKPTSQLDTETPEPEAEDDPLQMAKSVPADVGGGGIGWKVVEKSEGMVFNLLPNKRGGGGINTGRLDGTGSDPAAAAAVMGGAHSSRVVPSGDDSEDGTRANAVGGTLLGLLAAASSLIWALYKFKPGLVGRRYGEDGSLRLRGPSDGAYFVDEADSDVLMPMFATTATGQRVPVARLTSATFQGANPARSDSVAQTYVSAVGGLDLGSAFVSLAAARASNAGSGIAGLAAGAGVVSRGTQSDMTSLMTSSHFSVGANGGIQWLSDAADEVVALTRRQSVGVELASAQTQTQTTDFPDPGDSLDEANATGPGTINGGIGYASGYDESFSSTSISCPSGVETGSPVAPVGDGNFRTLSPLQFGTLRSANSYEMESVTVGGYSSDRNQYGHGTSADGKGKDHLPPSLASEVIRVDCILLTTNGRYVVTGSIYGPPQVWDIKTGELVKVMTGSELSSTDLHLAGGDSLLVGQVADVTPIDSTETVRVTPRVLQIWDFTSGNPLNMPRREPCTASRLMPDGERIALARAEKSGSGGITVTIWDLPGNQPVQTLHHDTPLGPTACVNHVLVSDDGRYVAAAYQEPSTARATFIVFDLVPNRNNAINAPRTVTFNASAEVSVALDDREAVVGTRKGELVVWNLSSGKVLRQLLLQPPPSGGGGGDGPPATAPSLVSRRGSTALVAHQGEVKAVAVSTDRAYLVSASVDQTLNVWHLETEQLRFALTGHTDEVTCCSFSYDSELIVSGSLDRTIRLWRSHDGLPVAVFVAGVDVFRVLVGNSKRAVVALGDQRASRKLIMLQIVRTKTKNQPRRSQTSSPNR